jgi:hypothetical protein
MMFHVILNRPSLLSTQDLLASCFVNFADPQPQQLLQKQLQLQVQPSKQLQSQQVGAFAWGCHLGTTSSPKFENKTSK